LQLQLFTATCEIRDKFHCAIETIVWIMKQVWYYLQYLICIRDPLSENLNSLQNYICQLYYVSNFKIK